MAARFRKDNSVTLLPRYQKTASHVFRMLSKEFKKNKLAFFLFLQNIASFFQSSSKGLVEV